MCARDSTLCAAIAFAIIAAAACKHKDVPPRNRLWSQVVEWAKPAVAEGPHEKLDHALERMRGNDAVSEVWYESKEKRTESDPSEDVAAAVQELIEWRQAGGGIERGSCADIDTMIDPRRIDALALARAALLWAPDDASHPRVEAALYLGHRLRAEAHTLLDVAIGLAIATDAVDWAKARGLLASKPFRDLAPQVDLAARAYAAEAVCQVAMLDTLLRDPERARTEIAVDSVDVLRREVERVRYFDQQLVHGIHANVLDRDKVEALMERQYADASKQDDPLGLLRMMSAGQRQIKTIHDGLERYEAFLNAR